MLANTFVILSLLAVAVAIVIPNDPIGPIHPIDPLPPILPWPPVSRPCNCANVHCPKGYHCEMVTQHIVCVTAPCISPKEPTCVRNIIGPIG